MKNNNCDNNQHSSSGTRRTYRFLYNGISYESTLDFQHHLQTLADEEIEQARDAVQAYMPALEGNLQNAREALVNIHLKSREERRKARRLARLRLEQFESGLSYFEAAQIMVRSPENPVNYQRVFLQVRGRMVRVQNDDHFREIISNNSDWSWALLFDRLDQCEIEVRKTLAICDRLLQDAPDDARFRFKRSVALGNLETIENYRAILRASPVFDVD